MSRRRRGAARILVLANPSRHSSDEDDSPPKPPPSRPPPSASTSGNTSTTSLAGHSASSHHAQHPPHPPPLRPVAAGHLAYPQRQRSSPLSDLSSQRGEGHRPSPVPAVDFPPHSDASSRSGSTPPPATPGFAQAAQPEFSSPLVKAGSSPRHVPPSHIRQASDTTRSTASPRSPHVPLAPNGDRERLFIMATATEAFSFIDITGARNADFIRERIFSSLQISDDDQAQFSIFKTETGEWPPEGQPLSADELLRVCLTEGDRKGSLKFLVAPSPTPAWPPRINTQAPLPIPPATGPSIAIPRPAGSQRDPSLSSSVSGGQGGYTASGSEADPDPRRHRRPRMPNGGWSNSPPSAVSGSPIRQYPAHGRATSPSPTTGLPPHPAAPRVQVHGGTPSFGSSADYYNRQPLPPTPSATSSSRQNSADSGLLHAHARPPVRRPSSGKKASFRTALPIPPPPKAPAPSAPHNTPGWSPQSARPVDANWLVTGQSLRSRPGLSYQVSPASSQLSSPQILKPAKSFDLLRNGGPTTRADASAMRNHDGRPPQSADPHKGQPVGYSLHSSTSSSRRPAWSDTDARGPGRRPSSPDQDSSSSNDYGEDTRIDSPIRDDESTLRADNKPSFTHYMGGGPPQLPPISTDMPLLPPDDDGDTIWVRPPQPTPSSQATPPSATQLPSPSDPDEDTIWVRAPQPAIQVKIDDVPIPPSSTSGSPIESLPRQSKPRPQSRFINRASVTWNVRPPPQEVYEHLEEFFPEHDLDKPLITVDSGGGDSGGSPNTPLSASAQTGSPLTRGGAGAGGGGAQMKHRKTIRNVASQGKKYMDKSSKVESPEAAMRRKRSTKLWGTKVEEVTPGAGRSGPSSSIPESPSSTAARPVTRWIKGDLIGKGTYGKVYLALNGNTGEMIAVKQVELPKTASDKADARQTTVVEAIKSESNVLRDLDHPNVVQYLGFEETTDYFNLFLEYVPGGSIGGVLRKVGKFDEEVSKSFTFQMLSGLEYLHSRGVWHRDLKGDNILVDPSGVCKISDFGISKRTADADKFDAAATNMQGSIFWMAPEVLQNGGQGYNAKVDIWSLGCVYVEMMTGRRPWQDDNFVAVMYKVGTAKEAPPIPNLSDVGRDFCGLCFEKDPTRRPTAAALRQHSYLVPKPGWTFTGFTGTS